MDDACEFARWLFWSGIPELLQAHSTPVGTPSPLVCDGAHFGWKLKEVLEACNEFYRTNRPSGLGKVEVESLHDKLDKLFRNQDLIAGQLSKLSLSSSPVPSGRAGPRNRLTTMTQHGADVRAARSAAGRPPYV